MAAVHRYEGTVNQVMGDGIMALFELPNLHEARAARSCYAALVMQSAMRTYGEEARRTHGIAMRIRVGLNSGEVVVRAIGNDLHMDYSDIAQTTHLAARFLGRDLNSRLWSRLWNARATGRGGWCPC
jgi:class 3 adenylate cyclase